MSEFAPTHTETKKPQNHSEADIIEFPLAADESKRFEDIDFAHDAALTENVNRDMVKNARADVERALAQNSPLVDKYKGKLANAELSAKMDNKGSEEFYDRFYRQRQVKKADEHKLAA